MPISSIYVPDSGPVDSPILFVGEAPGAFEENERLPFVGESGNILLNCLGRNGLSREEVRLSNLCHYRPLPNNHFEKLFNSRELKEGIEQLYKFIAERKPTVIAALGNYPLKYLTGKESISRWRGSVLPYINDPSIKVIPTYHPSAVLRERDKYPVFDVDIKRIIDDSKFREFNLPSYDLVLNPQGLDLEEAVMEAIATDRLAVDIETVKSSRHILCVGFAVSAKRAIVIAPHTLQAQIAIRRILESEVKKIFHFGTFDVTQLRLNGYPVVNYWWDTLTAQHCLNPELPRSLAFLASIYTRQPYYKQEGRGEIPGDTKAWGTKVDKQKLYEYNGKDCCVTYAIQLEQEKELALDKLDRSTFDFEMSEIPMAIDIGLAGMLRDEERRKLLDTYLKQKWARQQFILDQLTGYETNVRSPTLASILYGHLGLPAHRNRAGKLTTDEDTIVDLITHCNNHLSKLKTDSARLDWKCKLHICKLILEIRGIRQLLSNYITKPTNDDGRVRSTVKVSGPETGRWAMEKFVDGSGVNAQTFPREAIVIPDDILDEKKVANVALSVEDEEETEDDGELVGA